MTKKQILERVSRIARVKRIQLSGYELAALADWYAATPSADKKLVQAANTRRGGVALDGSGLLLVARFLG